MTKRVLGATIILVAKAIATKTKRSVVVLRNARRAATRRRVRSVVVLRNARRAATRRNVRSVSKGRSVPIARKISAAKIRVNAVRQMMIAVKKEENAKKVNAARKVNVPWMARSAPHQIAMSFNPLRLRKM
jgi:hypothetical protein